MSKGRRTFLFLQGPMGSFFRSFGHRLVKMGHRVIRVNVSGGDFIDWHGRETVSYRGKYKRWPSWIAGLMVREKVTDLILLADYRAMHVEATEIAKFLKIRVIVFEEGYIRPNYVTMEEGGVNGTSSMPRDPEQIRALSCALPKQEEEISVGRREKLVVRNTVIFLAGRSVLWPLYPFYKNHRPYSVFSEYILGWIPRLLTRKRQARRTEENLKRLKASGRPFFLFPLQVDADAQVRMFSPFTGMREAISHIMASFAKHAPREMVLVVKNHPLDCGRIEYYRYVREYAKALRIDHRVFFLEYGNNKQLVNDCRGLVMLNSTFGAEALAAGKPVYYVGKAIFAVPGLGASEPYLKLAEYWNNPPAPDGELFEQFMQVLKSKALLNGDFFTDAGRARVIAGALERLEIGPAGLDRDM